MSLPAEVQAVKNRMNCLECGAHLAYEEFGQYGIIRMVNYNGKLQKKVRRVDYGGNDVSPLVYCPECQWQADDVFLAGDEIQIIFYTDRGKDTNVPTSRGANNA